MGTLRDVYIIGVGETAFGMLDDDYHILGQQAVRSAIKDAGVSWREIQSAFVGNGTNGITTGQRIFRDLGMCGKLPVINVESACSSGAMAVHSAYIRVAAGIDEIAIGVGCENASLHRESGSAPAPGEGDIEAFFGAVMVAKYALRAQRYIYETGTKVENLALVTVKNRRHATNNPFAWRKGKITVEEILSSRMISTPLTLDQCCAMTDGAGAVIVASEEIVKKLGITKPVRIAASTVVSGPFDVGFKDETGDDITTLGANKAYEESGIGPEDIDMVECHDAFTICEPLYYEAMGFCKRGEGMRMLLDGETTHGGKVVWSPRGGMLSYGHPMGASGAVQIVENVRQLRRVCTGYQVEGAKTALSHVTGGGVQGTQHAACTIHILTI
ncbi:MAG: 3-oxoadipyl-CoA/3-oxo-5,6-dehydrosuberyl-CoA thiolase [Syntrophorhabdus sp. PtaU1.Bin058]|nr:MAG: 3-oxoadipyl-CoA/3-oxo-5,6-dehydrosuberyl-CoA thiolase [Syntrophorhabdus sp. PtaU1.Bin058]